MAPGLSDTLPLAISSNRMSTNWLLQEDGSYKPVRVERPGHLLVSSMIHSSNEKSGGATQTWGIVATLIKQHDQLLESQPLYSLEEEKTVTDSVVATIVEAEHYIDDDDTSIDSTMDVDHDAFRPWLTKEDVSEVDPLTEITVEGSQSLQHQIRILLEKYRSVFATTLSPEPATIPPFELDVDRAKWEVFKNGGPPRV